MNQVIGLFGGLLEWFYWYTKDYGLAIVCLTVTVKLCLLPLNVCQRKGMETKRAGTGSCLLLFLTLPMLTGLYQAVLAGTAASVGSRLCPWVGSLLVRDPYGILPALSAVVQLIPQTYPWLSFFQKLQLPKTSKGMLMSSAVMTFLICLPLPAAVGLYYLTSGIFAALEQMLYNGIQMYRLRGG